MPDYLATVILVAARHYQAANEKERDAILHAMVEHLDHATADEAAAIIHHRAEAARRQMQLFDRLTRAA